MSYLLMLFQLLLLDELRKYPGEKTAAIDTKWIMINI